MQAIKGDRTRMVEQASSSLVKYLMTGSEQAREEVIAIDQRLAFRAKLHSASEKSGLPLKPGCLNQI